VWDARVVVGVWEGWMVYGVRCVDGEGMVGGDAMRGKNAGEGRVADAGNVGPVEVE